MTETTLNPPRGSKRPPALLQHICFSVSRIESECTRRHMGRMRRAPDLSSKESINLLSRRQCALPPRSPPGSGPAPASASSAEAKRLLAPWPAAAGGGRTTRIQPRHPRHELVDLHGRRRRLWSHGRRLGVHLVADLRGAACGRGAWPLPSKLPIVGPSRGEGGLGAAGGSRPQPWRPPPLARLGGGSPAGCRELGGRMQREPGGMAVTVLHVAAPAVVRREGARAALGRTSEDGVPAGSAGGEETVGVDLLCFGGEEEGGFRMLEVPTQIMPSERSAPSWQSRLSGCRAALAWAACGRTQSRRTSGTPRSGRSGTRPAARCGSPASSSGGTWTLQS